MACRGSGSCIVEGGGGGTGATGLNQNHPEDAADDCSSMVTASICTEFVRSFSTTGMASYSTTPTVSRQSRSYHVAYAY